MRRVTVDERDGEIARALDAMLTAKPVAAAKLKRRARSTGSAKR